MSVRLHFIVEGQTEETFVNRVLSPHLVVLGIYGDARCVMTGRKRSAIHRGGVTSYGKVRNDIRRWMAEDGNSDARFTTMFDLYALPSDFPGRNEARGMTDPYEKVKRIESAMFNDLGDYRFIPHIQLHEFEALILADPGNLNIQFSESERAIRNLVTLTKSFDTPELIDEGAETSPSKRIIAEIPEYKGRKTSAGPIVVQKIGLPTMRAKCPHFDGWITKLESLANG
ncbi:MAG TPA: DUF4276 family protein [Candidatus Brocadiia bacterium]|nr:DUF4276 family protein [Candidatus Brocadiia bacterium]